MQVYWLSAKYAEEYIKNVERSTTRKVYDVVCKDIISRYLKNIKARKCLDAGSGLEFMGYLFLSTTYLEKLFS